MDFFVLDNSFYQKPLHTVDFTGLQPFYTKPLHTVDFTGLQPFYTKPLHI